MCVSFLVCGSYICRCRLEFCIGNTFADGCVDPCLQNAGVSNGSTADVSHNRFFSSIIGLCTLFLLVQITSSPQYGDGAAIFGFVGGVFGSRTVRGTRVAVCFTGSSTGT